MSTFTTVQGEVEALYVGYFMRAGDPAGEQYWENELNSGAVTWAQAAASFSVQLEAQGDYPFLATGTLGAPETVGGVATYTNVYNFINAVYEDLFNRAVDSAGLAYYSGLLVANIGKPGVIGGMILNIISGATTGGADDLTLQAKVAVASYITNSASAAQVTWSAPVQTYVESLIAATTSADVATEEAAWAAYISGITNPAHTFTLTIAQDTFTTGAGNDFYNAPLAGIFGNQQTLTSFDTLVDRGTNNTLNAFFAGSSTIGGLTIQGIQNWNFSNATGGTVNIIGGANVGGPGPVGGATNPGVMALTLKNSLVTTLNVGGVGGGGGGAGSGIQSLLSSINLTNDVGANTVSVYESAALFSGITASTAITVTVLNAATTGTDTIDAGPDTGATGYLTWNLDSTGGKAVTNTIALGATSSTNAATLNLADDGASTVLLASGSNSSGLFNWANLTAINGGTTTGTWTITGAETGGFLTDKVSGALALTLGSGAGNTVDLTSYTSGAGNLNLNLGTGAGDNLHINSGLADTTVAFGGFAGVTNLFDAETAGGALGGTVNMTFFPGVTSLTLETATGGGAPALNANLVVENIPNVTSSSGFVINLQSTILGAFNEGFIAATGGTLTVDVAGTVGGTGVFTVGGFSTLDLNSTGSETLGGTNFLLQGPIGSTATESLSITETIGNVLVLGQTQPNPVTNVTGFVGHDTVTVLGGAVFSPVPGSITEAGSSATLDLGVTNALNINVAGQLIMFGPDDSFTYAGANHVGDQVSAGGVGSFLSGTLGPVTLINTHGQNGYTGATSGPNAGATDDILSDTAGGSTFTGDGGGDAITVGQALAGGGNSIVFGEFFTGSNGHEQVMTDNTDAAYSGFWGIGGAGTAGTPTVIAANAHVEADNTTVTGFTVGTTAPDGLFFNVDSWAGGANGPGGLVTGNGAAVSGSLATVLQVLVTPGAEIAAATNVVAYDLPNGPLNGAAGLAAALQAVPTAIETDGTAAGNHMLFMYNDNGTLQLADVDFQTAIAAGGTTAGTTIAVSDIVNLGSVSLTALASHPNDIHFFAITG